MTTESSVPSAESTTEPTSTATATATLPPSPTPTVRRSNRTTKSVQPLTYGPRFDQIALASLGDVAAYLSYFTMVNVSAPAVYKAAASDPDTLSWDQAMKDQYHVQHWQAAAEQEIESLEAKGTWIEVPKSDAKTKILPGTWVFRRKRTTDGSQCSYQSHVLRL
jgi:hypothetical protein